MFCVRSPTTVCSALLIGYLNSRASLSKGCAAMGQAFGKWWTGVTTEWHDFFEKAGWAAADPLEDVGLPFKGVDFSKDFEVMQLCFSCSTCITTS
jgi:hypothetical protein